MAISTYSELKTAVTDYMDRSDLSARQAEFVLAGEGWLNRQLRILDMIQVQNGTVSTSFRTIDLPARYMEKVSFRLTDPQKKLIYVTPEHIGDYGDLTSSGEPSYYTVTSYLEFDRIPDSAYSYTLTYYRGYLLSGASDTNYVLTNYPQAYLYASVRAGAVFCQDWELVKAMDTLLRAEIAQIKNAERRRRGTDDSRLVTELNYRPTFDIAQG